MKLTSKIQSLDKIIRPAVDACGVSLWGIEFLPQGKNSLLRVFIDVLPQSHANSSDNTQQADAQPVSTDPTVTNLIDPDSKDIDSKDIDSKDSDASESGSKLYVTADDCARVSHQVSAVLDVHDPISGEFTLEVSSPGWDRPFFTTEQMQAYIGQPIHIRLIQAVDNRRKITGILEEMTPDSLRINVEGTPILLKLDNIDRANLEYQE